MRALLPWSAEGRRAHKTVARGAEKCVAHVGQRQRRRVPLCVRYGAIALTVPCGVRLSCRHAGWGHGWPLSVGVRLGQSFGACAVAISLSPVDWPFAMFKVLMGENLALTQR